jgi:hypothetical protein
VAYKSGKDVSALLEGNHVAEFRAIPALQCSCPGLSTHYKTPTVGCTCNCAVAVPVAAA